MARPLGTVPEPNRSRLIASAKLTARALKNAEVEVAALRREVLDAAAAGGSVREIAVLTGKSTNTIQRWLKEG
ncbi:helix-turn-helix DNA binding protein [Mycobacterium phage Demsculpinboyz]|uniref:Helix-turn-helix DNA binding protein n=1 Tax=Mycobacterium phage Demsculpinboyz TaxID=2041528 RepID=A0A2D1GA26_9CAUD|nr:HTH DNA binding protein [Mycobacterium phage Demsculpinboyz]ATN88643.1 helix-turn-helix DNA binding protein [Mycobacterium phage Demsculpinboyz]